LQIRPRLDAQPLASGREAEEHRRRQAAARYRSGDRGSVLRRAGLEGERLDGNCGMSDTTGERITGTGRRRLISLAAGDAKE
jgi:hypothetical protein